MTQYLMELYVSRTNCAAVAIAAKRLSRAAAELTAEGTPVRLARSIFVPEDETCFLLVEESVLPEFLERLHAATDEHVREAAGRAAVAYERIVETATT